MIIWVIMLYSHMTSEKRSALTDSALVFLNGGGRNGTDVACGQQWRLKQHTNINKEVLFSSSNNNDK